VLADVDLAATAELMTTHRAPLLLALIGGRPLPASELASRAGISPSLASAHLSKLLDGGLIAVTQHGRERHYRLADPRVAEVLEAILSLASDRRAAQLRETRRSRQLRHARICYDHLAGRLGVALTEALQRQRLVEPDDHAYRLTDSGHRRLGELGIDTAELRQRRRTFARPCLDWSEQREHLAGALGAGIAQRLLELDWIRPIPGGRALQITDTGARELRDTFAVNLTAASATADAREA
jgi:DNA-binding transcriptional ArsR family regulator